MRPEAVFGLDRQRDIEMVRRVREVIGDELELVVDTPWGTVAFGMSRQPSNASEIWSPIGSNGLSNPYRPITLKRTPSYVHRS